MTFRNDAPRKLWGFLAAQPERVTYSLSAYFSGGRLTGDVALACVAAALLRHALLVADDDDVLQGHPLQPFMLRKVLAIVQTGGLQLLLVSPKKDAVRDELFAWVVTLLRDLLACEALSKTAMQAERLVGR